MLLFNSMNISTVPETLVAGMETVIRGKTDFLHLFVAAALSGAHILLDDLPGLGKTTVAKCFARLIGDTENKALSFKRIQFTPDLLPYDITGVDIFDPESHEFRFLPGPIFANIVLADEINRTTPKVQSALLEVMAENQVSIGTTTRMLSDPFIVIATQNPVESEGTFPLPAAQLDRFMMCLSLGYPDRIAELAILEENPAEGPLSALQPLISQEAFVQAKAAVKNVFCHQKLKEAIADIVRKSRDHKGVILGASPRAGLHYLQAVKGLAFVKGRDFVIDEDLVSVSVPVLAHRLKLRDPRSKPEEFVRELVFERIKKIPE